MSVQEVLQKKKFLKDLVKEIDTLSKRMNSDWKIMEELEVVHKKQLEELEATKEKMRELVVKTAKAFSALKKLDLKKEELKKAITDSDVLDVITVDCSFNKELSNGLIGLKRNIVMKLLKVIGEENKTRNIIGMAQEFYEWSGQRIFRWCREPVTLSYPTETDEYKGTVAGGKVPKPSGRGKCVYGGANTGTIYEGGWVEGRKEGKGKIVHANDSEFTGIWINGLQEGEMTSVSSDGSRCEGYSFCGRLQGRGKIVNPGGGRLEVEFVNDGIVGWGVEIAGNGEKYVGYWVEGFRAGSGSCIRSDGTKYTGNWMSHMRDGYGVETDKEGKVVLAGIWANDSFVE